MEIGYKVVCLVEGEFRSFNNPEIKTSIIYSTGKWSKPKPKCGPSAVFSSLEDAKKFLSVFDFKNKGIIFCSLYKPSVETILYAPFFITSKEQLPEGTVIADSVLLLHRVK